VLVIVAGVVASASAAWVLLTGHRGASVTNRGAVPATANTQPSSADSHPVRPPMPPGKPAQSGLAAPPAVLNVGATRLPIDPAALTADQRMQLPPTVHRVAWWSYGAAPGDAEGTAVLAGHVDTRDEGIGPLASLAALRPGDPVSVTDHSGGRHQYVVKALRSYPTGQLPHDLFTTAGAPRLALITCAGEWNRHSRAYERNLVVWAVPAAHQRSESARMTTEQ
jgi:hypothetical protein